jgi:sugar lactone lactonase YvrE
MAPTVTSGTRGGVGGAFDLQGNLWVRGQTASDPYLMRYSALALSGTGTPIPDRSINLQGVTCEGSGGLAFDESGNLWVSIGCQAKVVRLTAAQISLSGTVLPSLQISGLVRPEGLAFDALGNLWIADDTHLRRFDAARLAANISTAADLRATFTTPTPPTPGADELSVNHLAFSPSGELWVSTYAQDALYRVEAALFAATGAQDSEVTRILYLSEFTTPRGFAFDNNGGLLIGHSTSTFARYAPLQLGASVLYPSTATPERVYTSAAILGFADGVALFPAPATSPLYSRRR